MTQGCTHNRCKFCTMYKGVPFGVRDLGLREISIGTESGDDWTLDRVHKGYHAADILELHAAHGYLLNCFLSSGANQRTDEFGGPVENRARMVCDIIRGIRKECGKADLVCVGRQLLCNPEWPNKIMQDRENEIRPCLSCFYGCMGALLARNEIARCSINPYVGFEDFQSENNVAKTANPKKILVVGGGISGLQFAIIAAKRGNQVIVAEKEERRTL